MERVVFITADFLKKGGFVQSNVEENLLSAVIYRVQKSMVRPLLGRKLYNRLLEGIRDSNLTSDESFLIDEYILDCIICASDFRSVIHTTYEIRNKTTGITLDQNQRPVTTDEGKILRDILRSDYEVARHDIICYLRNNSTLFPEYNSLDSTTLCGCKVCSDEIPDRGKPFKQIYF